MSAPAALAPSGSPSTTPVAVAEVPAKTRSLYLVGPAYDWAFFLLPPTLSLAAGIGIASSEAARAPFLGMRTSLPELLLGVMIHAHLVAVVFRSHLNAGIFRKHRVRFVVVPLVLFGLLVASRWASAASLVLATFWDVWHSGAQTFGFGRIYDRNAGAPPEVGRRLDFALNQLLYAGPIFAGVTFVDHVGELEAFASIDDPFAAFLASVPADVLARQAWITWTVVTGGTLFVAYYVFAYVRLARGGYAISPLKIVLFASTGLCSVYTWAFNTWGEAFFIMNIFHAVQYLAIVWATERGSVARLVGRAGRSAPRGLPAAIFFGSVLAYGTTIELLDPSFHVVWAASMVVSLMHFWYDGFVWSVRAREV